MGNQHKSEELQRYARAVNELTDFLGKRDLPLLNKSSLRESYGIEQVDVLILFGGVIPFGCDVAAAVWRCGLARHLMVVGGIGHTTQSLRDKFQARFPDLAVEGRTEAEMIADYLAREYDIHDILLETASTNCGNNVTNALQVLQDQGIEARSLLIMQDPSMQRRMAAGFAKALGAEPAVRVISYAPYHPELTVANGQLQWSRSYWGLWDIPHYVTLLLGDVSRLRDDAAGYGPQGKDFIVHVDIPAEVEESFKLLSQSGLGEIREANEAYCS